MCCCSANKKPFLDRIEGFVFIASKLFLNLFFNQQIIVLHIYFPICLFYLTLLSIYHYNIIITGLLIFFQGMYAAGLIPAALSTWEKAFQLTTTEMAPAVSAYVITKLIFGIPVTYYCSAGHIPHHLAWQFALIGLSSIITAIPWILTNVEKSASFPNICYLAGNPASAACDATMVSNGLQYFVFVAQTINGFAACCLYTLVPSYIETNSEKTAGGKNLAYFLASGPLGVAVGFIAGGMAVDAGIWGIPFLIVGCCLIIFSIFMYRMPKSMVVVVGMANSVDIELENQGDTEQVKKRRSSLVLPKKGMKAGMIDFKNDAKQILTNGVWWFFALAASVEVSFEDFLLIFC